MTAKKYPEHAKLLSLDDHQLVVDFMQYVTGDCRFVLGKFEENGYDRLMPMNPSIQDLIAGYCGADPVVLEKERREMIREMGCKALETESSARSSETNS